MRLLNSLLVHVYEGRFEEYRSDTYFDENKEGRIAIIVKEDFLWLQVTLSKISSLSCWKKSPLPPTRKKVCL